MKLQRSPQLNPALLYIVPAIQLPLILVFFILLGGSYLLQPGVSVSLPDSPFVLSPQRGIRVVTLAAPPSTAIFFADQETDLAGLRRALEPMRGGPQTLVIRADRGVLYDRVMVVLNMALEMGFPAVLATAESEGQAP